MYRFTNRYIAVLKNKSRSLNESCRAATVAVATVKWSSNATLCVCMYAYVCVYVVCVCVCFCQSASQLISHDSHDLKLREKP